jgi:hypothetical protein
VNLPSFFLFSIRQPEPLLKGKTMKKVNLRDLNETTILLNLLITQLLTLAVGVAVILLQKSNPWSGMFSVEAGWRIGLWGAVLAGGVLLSDLLISRFVPEEVTDDGGINELIFASRPFYQIALLALFVSFCEELLFRGAIQHAWGPYWTSVLFAAIHFRYLRHWLMTGLVFCISYGLGWVYLRTGTLWTPIFAHFIVDLVMGCIIRYRRDS